MLSNLTNILIMGVWGILSHLAASQRPFEDTCSSSCFCEEEKNPKRFLKQCFDKPTSDICKCSASAKKSIHLSKGNENHSSWDNHCHSLLSTASRKITVRQILNCWTDECAENASHKSVWFHSKHSTAQLVWFFFMSTYPRKMLWV